MILYGNQYFQPVTEPFGPYKESVWAAFSFIAA